MKSFIKFPFIIRISLLIGSTSAIFQEQTQIQLSSSPIDQSSLNENYLEGCYSILRGFDQIDSEQNFVSSLFGTWEYQDPKSQFLNFFENRKGIVRITSSETSNWLLDLTFYDGDYIDKKRAQMSLYLANVMLSQSNATIQTDSNRSYPIKRYSDVKFDGEAHISGQFSFYFLHKFNKTPITNFQDSKISNYTVQFSFLSTELSPYSITTSLFSRFDDVPRFDHVFHYILLGIYLFVSLFSWHTESLARKVSILTLSATCVSSCYLTVWMLFQLLNHSSRLHFILLSAAIFDLLKQFSFFCKSQISANAIIFGIISYISIMGFFAAISYCLTIWMNLIPSLLLLIPLAIQMTNPAQPLITRFQISHWLCMSMWMGYAYLNPDNIFLLSPRPILAMVFFSIILLQYLAALCVLYKRRRNYQSLLATYRDEEADRIAYWRRQVYNPNDVEEQPHEYTVVIKKEDPAKLKNDCAICFENLLGKRKQKLYKTPCGHIFHEVCLRAWGSQKLDCPCCRKKLPYFKY